MILLENKDYKIIFGTSPKSGNTFIRRLHTYIECIDNYEGCVGGFVNGITHRVPSSPLPDHLSGYIIYIVLRNPFERVISGFLDKYNKTHPYRKQYWTSKMPCTFKNFVNQLKNNSSHVEPAHFNKQLAGNYITRITKHDKVFVYDLKNMDFTVLENRINTQFPEEILTNPNKNTFNTTLNNQTCIDYPVYDTNIDDICSYPEAKYFYTADLKDIIYNIYSEDFEFAKLYGIDYNVDVCK
jgi:hypothetical protein